MTQQWHATIHATLETDSMRATLELVGDGDQWELMQLADKLNELGFRGPYVLRPVEEPQSQEAIP